MVSLYEIRIRATGESQRGENPADAENMAKVFVQSLKDAGHLVELAEFRVVTSPIPLGPFDPPPQE